MVRLAARGNRAAALAWAAIAGVGLGGVLLVWLISPSAAATAGYGSPLSIVLLVLSTLLTAIGWGVMLFGHRLSRSIKLAITLLIAATAGVLIPLAMTGLLTAEGGGYGLLLVLAVIGMEFLAVQIPRTARPAP